MAKIIIKHREDPIFIENERAQKIKDRWIDENVPRTTMIEITHEKGTWMGTIGDIKNIDIEKPVKKQGLPPIEVDTRTPEEKAAAVARIREKVRQLGLDKKIN